MLLRYCLWFYAVMWLRRRLRLSAKLADCLLAGGVAAHSLVVQLGCEPSWLRLGCTTTWAPEEYGLVWGLLMQRYNKRISRLTEPTKRSLLCGLAASVAVGVSYLMYKHVWFWGGYVLKVVLGALLLWYLLTLTSRIRFGSAAARRLGDISYEVYLLHGAALAFVARMFPSLPSGAYLLSAVALTIALSLVANTAVKPLIRMLRA